VVCLPDRYRACFEPLHQKHGLFKIVFSSKKHVFVNENICNNHLRTKLHFLKKIRPELWILMTFWGVIHGCHSRKQSGSKQFHTGSLVVLRVRDSLRNLCRALGMLHMQQLGPTMCQVGPYDWGPSKGRRIVPHHLTHKGTMILIELSQPNFFHEDSIIVNRMVSNASLSRVVP